MELAQLQGITMYIPTVSPDAAMPRSTIFKTNRTQAVRLPKAVAFPEDVRQVEIIKIGQARLVIPVGRRWDDFFMNGPQVSEDFMSDRAQPPAERREPL
jgi:antitoxin VapB